MGSAGSHRSGSRPGLAAQLLLLPWTSTMPQFQTWEEFSRAAEKLYLSDPMKVNAPGLGMGRDSPDIDIDIDIGDSRAHLRVPSGSAIGLLPPVPNLPWGLCWFTCLSTRAPPPAASTSCPSIVWVAPLFLSFPSCQDQMWKGKTVLTPSPPPVTLMRRF